MANKNPRKLVAVLGEGTRLSDLAYARILETLFERRIAAGAFVSQTELVELTGVPVGPLRDALRALEAEGVLTIHPRSGIQFVKPGLELTRSTYQFRSIIEVAAVAVFAETAGEEIIEDLAQQHRAAETSLQKDGLSATIRDDLERLEELLHGSIVASLNNPLIETSYREFATICDCFALIGRSPYRWHFARCASISSSSKPVGSEAQTRPPLLCRRTSVRRYNAISASISFRGIHHKLTLNGTLQQRCDELLLKDQKQQHRRRQNDERASAQQRNVGSPLALKRPKRPCHRPLQRVLD